MQFDNLKLVYKQMEDAPGKLVENIKKSFRFSTSLAEFVEFALINAVTPRSYKAQGCILQYVRMMLIFIIC